MESDETADIVVKKEPIDNVNDEQEEGEGQAQTSNEITPSSSQGRLRYVSRRGRPPGGGYSMKSSHSQYANFSSSAGDLSRHASLSCISAQDLLKSSTAADSLDIRRFGFQGFDGDKNSFRCDGCDVVFSSRDTYAMHMLLRAKNESCVALPTSAISPNPENPTPREKFERELRQQAMLMAIRNQAAVMSKAAAAMMPSLPDSLQPLTASNMSAKEDLDISNGSSLTEHAMNLSSLFSMDAFGLYVDPKQYRRFLAEYGLRTSSSSLVSMLEQMSCSLCGEMFSNKDALAMHVMYHTRDEENDNKPGFCWNNLPGSNTKHQSSSNSSSTSSPTTCMTTLRKPAPSEEKKGKSHQTQDRELTAERIAELKRMAIESSLRSPSKKSSSSGRTLSRPKSVTQDAPINTTAQTRPLSADDVSKFSNGDLGNNNSGGIGSEQRKDLYDAKFSRKRPLADSLYNSSNISSEAARPKVMRRRDDEHYVANSSEETRSEGSPCGEDDQSSDKRKVKSMPYLEDIMTQDAVLVPIETMETGSTKVKDDTAGEASALDFSLCGRRRSEGSGRTTWYSAPSKPIENGKQDEDQATGVTETAERELSSFSAYYHSTADSQEGHKVNHYSGMNGARTSRCDYQQAERPVRVSRVDSPGRVGEARYCPHCEILYLDVTLFHLHMGLHNVNNPWQCNTCGLVCAGRLDFNTHVLHY